MNAHGAHLRGRLLRFGVPPATVPDILQDVWLRAWQHYTISIRQPRAWLWRIAHNLVVTQYRTTARITYVETIPDVTDTRPLHDLLYQDAELFRRAMTVLADLPKELQVCVALVDCCGWSLSGTAKLLSMHESTVRRKLKHAHTQVQKAIS
jgi:RNA polymerase sigma factor (sigma-70 family)